MSMTDDLGDCIHFSSPDDCKFLNTTVRAISEVYVLKQLMLSIQNVVHVYKKGRNGQAVWEHLVQTHS